MNHEVRKKLQIAHRTCKEERVAKQDGSSTRVFTLSCKKRHHVAVRTSYADADTCVLLLLYRKDYAISNILLLLHKCERCRSADF